MVMTRIRELAAQLPDICGCAVWINIHGVFVNDGTAGRRKKEKTVGLLTEASDGNQLH
jgi:hypothetical protein